MLSSHHVAVAVGEPPLTYLARWRLQPAPSTGHPYSSHAAKKHGFPAKFGILICTNSRPCNDSCLAAASGGQYGRDIRCNCGGRALRRLTNGDACWLAKGYRVLVVDRATFPSDTLSTHIVHPRAADALSRWGLLDRLVASGCPPIHTYAFDFGPFTLSGAPGTTAHAGCLLPAADDPRQAPGRCGG